MKSYKSKILIFFLSYKASFRILKSFKEIPFKKLKEFKIKVLVSDDCSNDDTIKYAYKIKKLYSDLIIKVNKKNLGSGTRAQGSNITV